MLLVCGTECPGNLVGGSFLERGFGMLVWFREWSRVQTPIVRQRGYHTKLPRYPPMMS